jgi:hypothetical protein
MHTLAAIGRFLRRPPPPPADLLEAYAHEVIPVLDRAEWLYEYWLEQSTLFTDGEKLGNVAAIHRWEIATMGRSLERVVPPAVLADAHERVVDALELASRAAQLLSNGSRFHNANAVCEGQALLTASRERRLAALRSMRRHLVRIQPVARPEPHRAPTPMPTDPAVPPPAPSSAEPAEPDRAVPSAQAPVPAGAVDALPPAVDALPPADPAAGAPPAPEAPAPAHPPGPASASPGAPPGDAAAKPSSERGWGRLFGSRPDQLDR